MLSKMRKILLLLVCLFSFIDGYSYDFIVDWIYYNITSPANLTVEVTGGGDYSGDILIPSIVQYGTRTFDVTSIGNNTFYGCTGLTSVTIPNSITSIGESSFYNCIKLTSITIPNSVTSILGGAFCSCIGLTSVTIPNSVISIGNNTFRDCTGLASINLPASVTSIGGASFLGCTKLKSITIPNSLSTIENNTFYGCTELTSVTIPNSVTSVGNGAFFDCNNLKSVTSLVPIPPIVGTDAFSGITYLDGILNVAKNCRSVYASSIGWKDFVNISEVGATIPMPTCETPTITYTNGQLQLYSTTKGAQYYYTLKDVDTKTSPTYSCDGQITLTAAYNITAYTTADGYNQSAIAVATLYWIKQSGFLTNNINQAKMRGVLVYCNNCTITLTGLGDSEKVIFYSLDGKMLGSTNAIRGIANYAVSNKVVIAKFSDSCIKIVVK